MEITKYFVIDFDSTFTKVEALDELAIISLQNASDAEIRQQAIKEITDKAMEGTISFRQALTERLAILNAHQKHIPAVVEALKQKVSNSFARNRRFFEEFADSILIVSSGFKEIIEPVVTEYGIKSNNIYANTFEFDASGNIIGFDATNVLSEDGGKVTLLKQLNLQGDVYVIGDGYTDYEVRAAGLANKFYAFTENVQRERVIDKADHVAASLDEFLYDNKLPAAFSFPKSRINVLILENIHPEAAQIFREEGYNVECISSALDEDELCEKIKNVSIIGIRSKTNITRKVLENAPRLMVVGAFCIGTNQIDLEACSERGIAVFNAPYSNTRSVVELAIGEIILLMRNIPDVSADLHKGKWNKTAKNSNEVRGKKLGIIGYGNIGAQLSVIAESLGMEVYFYDIVDRLALGNAKKCKTMDELLSLVDIVTLHVDGRKENKNIIDKNAFDKMKKGVIFLNLARGHVVDIDALVENIKNGKIRGAAVDVFPQEPKSNDELLNTPLLGLPNLILTPHIGGSTAEAQQNIANYVPSKVIDYINTGNTYMSVNFPNIQLPTQQNAHRLIHLHENKSGILAQINNILAKYQVNILGQYLKTNEKTGYVITDVDRKYPQEAIDELKKISGTIRFRILY
jgi:D-3-phosphoglycerate dehydrogenase